MYAADLGFPNSEGLALTVLVGFIRGISPIETRRFCLYSMSTALKEQGRASGWTVIDNAHNAK